MTIRFARGGGPTMPQCGRREPTMPPRGSYHRRDDACPQLQWTPPRRANALQAPRKRRRPHRGPHRRPHGALALDGTFTPTTIYVGSDLGVLRSVDRGLSWTVLDDIHLLRAEGEHTQRWHPLARNRHGRLHSAPEWVGEGSAVGVDDCGNLKFDGTAANGDIPMLSVYLVVMRRAQQATIGHRGFAVVDPVPAVVGLTQPWWPVAAGEGAPAVAGHQRPANRARCVACPSRWSR